MTRIATERLVLWDLDGTILDSFGVFSEVMSEIAAIRGEDTPSESALRSNFHGSLNDSINAILRLVDKADQESVLADFLKIQESYYQDAESHLYSDAVGLAERLHTAGVTQGIITNREHQGRGVASPRHIVESSSLKNYIDFIVCGDDVAVRKPDPGVINEVLTQKSELRNKEMIVIGDQFVDAQLAQNLGARAILAVRGDEVTPHLENLQGSLDFLTQVTSLDEVRVEVTN